MTKIKHSLIPVLALALAACDPTPPPQPETAPEPSAAFETQVRALDKARAVEGQVMDATEAQRRQLDGATEP